MTKFGVFVPQGWKLDLVDVKDPIAKWERMVEVAQAAEASGWDSLWIYDHFHTVPKVEIEAAFECWTSMAALARETKSIRLGQLVTCNSYRQPSLLAKMASCVDVMSHGRLNFGIGAGWLKGEYDGYGYDYPPAPIRLKMLGEALEVITRMWTEERASFEGQYYHLDGAINEPKPVQKPYPPIYVGGSGEKVTLKLAAKYADACSINVLPAMPVDEATFSAPKMVAHKFDVLRRHCEALGRPYDQVRKTMHTEAMLTSSDAETERMVEELRRPHVPPGSYRHLALIGTPEQCRAQLQAYIDVGVEEIMLAFPNASQVKPVEIFAREVLSGLR